MTSNISGWVDPARLSTIRSMLIDVLTHLDHTSIPLSDSSQVIATSLRRVITDDLIIAIDRIVTFDGWHRWESATLGHQLAVTTPTFRFSTHPEELAALTNRIAQGGINENVTRALAAHIDQNQIDLGLANSDLGHPASDWAMLLQQAVSTRSAAMTGLLAAAVTHDRTTRLAEAFARRAQSDQHVARLLGEVAPQLGDSALRSALLTLTAPASVDRVGGVDPVAEHIALDALLLASAGHPSVVQSIFDDYSRLANLVTNPFLSPIALEAAGCAGMGLSGASPLLRDLTTIHDSHGELSVGGTRLAATALISDLDQLASTIDLPIIRAHGPRGPIDIGTREQLSALLAAILSDHRSKTALGLALHDLRELRIERSIDELTIHQNIDFERTLSGQLADISDVGRTLDEAARSAHDADMLHRSDFFAGLDSGLSIAGTLATVAAPVIGGTVALTLSGSRELADIINAVTADHTPPDDITELINMETTISVLTHVVEQPQLHPRFQLANITSSEWSALSQVLNEFSSANTGEAKARVYGDVIQLITRSVELTTFVNTVQVLSRSN